MRRQFFALSLLLASMALLGCGNNNPFYAPEKNPNPKYFMTVKGHIDPGLIEPIGLQILSTFISNNRKCEYDASGGLEGAMVPLQRQVVHTITFDSNGNYEKQIPIDYYLPGKCQWSINDMAYKIHLNNFSPITIADFTHNNKLIKDFKHAVSTIVRCNNSLVCSWDEVGQYISELPLNQSYIFELNFIKK